VTCGEFREVAAAYALGALDRDELREAEAHLAGAGPHEGCLEALEQARATATALAAALPAIRPPLAVWRAIEARLGREPSRPRRSLLGPGGWAALAAAAAIAVLWVGERSAASRREAELSALRAETAIQRQVTSLLSSAGTRVVPLQPVPGRAGTATALLDLPGRRGVLLSSLPAAPPGRDYQLWVLRGKEPPVPAGLLRVTGGQVVAGELERAALEGAQPDAVAVSIEPSGGSRSPTEVILVGKLAG
jgi:anti-sigma-K factor RskA